MSRTSAAAACGPGSAGSGALPSAGTAPPPASASPSAPVNTAVPPRCMHVNIPLHALTICTNIMDVVITKYVVYAIITALTYNVHESATSHRVHVQTYSNGLQIQQIDFILFIRTRVWCSLSLFLPSILSNDRFVNPCLFTIYIFEGHDCDETKLHFFSKKHDILPLIINFHFLNFDGSGSSDSNMLYCSNTKL